MRHLGRAEGEPERTLCRSRGPDWTPAPADIYAAGAISWEILAGRPTGTSPAHLAKVRPDLPRELADAVMACLERSPDWRPSDLTYLAQMAAARRRATDGPAAPSVRAQKPPRAVPQPKRRGPSRRTWPLLVALVVVLGLAALAARPYLPGITGLLSSDAPATPAAPAATASAAPTPGATAAPTPAPTPANRAGAGPAAAPGDEPPADVGAAPETPSVSASSLPAQAPPTLAQEEPPDLSPPREIPTATAPADPVGRTDMPPPLTPAAAPSTASAPKVQAPTTEAPLPPAVLTALAPPTVKRPGKVLVDLRGVGLRPEHQARVLAVKKVPWGIKVLRQKHVSDTLITVLLELEDGAEPGEYAIAVEDGQGVRSEPLAFTVTK